MQRQVALIMQCKWTELFPFVDFIEQQQPGSSHGALHKLPFLFWTSSPVNGLFTLIDEMDAIVD